MRGRFWYIDPSKSIFDEKELLALANGSPGALLRNLKVWKEIPSDLFDQIIKMPDTPIEVLSLARNVTETLNIDQQLWFINFQQHMIWEKENNSNLVKKM